MTLLVYAPADFPYTDILFRAPSGAFPPTVAQADSIQEAHIIMRINRAEIVIEPRTLTLRNWQVLRRDALPAHRPCAPRSRARLRRALHLLPRLHQRGGAAPHLLGDYPDRKPDLGVGHDGNMVVDGAVLFKSENGVKYGLTIRNASSDDLFPYLFYFDPETYTISVHLPFDSRSTAVPNADSPH